MPERVLALPQRSPIQTVRVQQMRSRRREKGDRFCFATIALHRRQMYPIVRSPII
ncbi:MAG: hypothetical protein HC936_01430 [Leptolyngbyaceae cyanobacterium SU_3_3]|nr:hypothetical protein [Leptolyngbyaceae cyanobacterium SU_3_3]